MVPLLFGWEYRIMVVSNSVAVLLSYVIPGLGLKSPVPVVPLKYVALNSLPNIVLYGSLIQKLKHNETYPHVFHLHLR